MKSVQEAG